MIRLSSLILSLLLLLTACGSQKSGVQTLGAASNATGSSLGSGTVIDGDGKVTEWVNRTQRDIVQTMLASMATATAENLAADKGCLGYDATNCKELNDMTSAQRLAAAKLAIEAAKLALARLPNIKFLLLDKQPVATGDDGKNILVNARRSPTADNTIEMAYAYANTALTAGDFQSTVDFQHTFVHELIHFESTPSQGKAVGDLGDYGGVSGRRLVNRAAADITGVYYRTMPLPTVKVTVDSAPTVSADIDGKANDDTTSLDFKFTFTAPTKSQILEISLTNGGTYKVNGDMTSTASAGATAQVSGSAKIQLRSGTVKTTFRIRVSDETGRETTSETSITPKLTAPPSRILYRFISITGNFSFSGASSSADPNWTVQGPAFKVLIVTTRSCSKPLYANMGQNDYSFNTTSGSLVGYGCDTAVGNNAEPLFDMGGAHHVYSRDITEVANWVNAGTYVNRGAIINVPR